MNGMNSHEARDGHALLHERIEGPLKAEIEEWKTFVLKLQEERNELRKENMRLKAILRKQIMIYRVDDQAYDREAEADKILAKVLSDE